MRGIILAAGMGKRLRPHTDDVPKVLVPLGGGMTPLHLTLANFQAVGIESCTLLAGYRADTLDVLRGPLADRYGVGIDVVLNEKALEWNNSYSLLLALRSCQGEDALVVNGDTVHPASFQTSLLASPKDTLTIAVDSSFDLAEEEMKVLVEDGRVVQISKKLEPTSAYCEYVGLSWLPGATHAELIRCLEAVVERDPQTYYEDGFQEYIDRGQTVGLVSTEGVAWTEIDDEADLSRAKGIVCQY